MRQRDIGVVCHDLSSLVVSIPMAARPHHLHCTTAHRTPHTSLSTHTLATHIHINSYQHSPPPDSNSHSHTRTHSYSHTTHILTYFVSLTFCFMLFDRFFLSFLQSVVVRPCHCICRSVAITCTGLSLFFFFFHPVYYSVLFRVLFKCLCT